MATGLASELRLPVIIHNRQSTKEMIEIMERSGWKKSPVIIARGNSLFPGKRGKCPDISGNGILIWLSGDISVIPKALDGGSNKGHSGRQAAGGKRMRLICRRKNSAGSANEPAYIVYTVEKMAEVFREDQRGSGQFYDRECMQVYLNPKSKQILNPRRYRNTQTNTKFKLSNSKRV